jgi:single-stranded-DNA-specific exonuclease
MQHIWTVLPDPPQSFLEKFPNLPPIVARLLFHRGLRAQSEIDEFINPDYSQDVHDPFLFKDMDKAVTRIFKAIENNERIIIHGDYDADGVSAGVILTSLFRALKYENFDVFLPHRETDGYGLNKKNVQLLHEENTKLLISCDCGISNAEEVELANSLGMDVIITDHHSIPKTIPVAYAIIHPKITDETYPDKNLAGGAVAFKLMQAILNRHAEENDNLPNGEKHAAFEKWQLDMTAIASVADMVPLLGESRTLTKYGLIVLNKPKRVGLKKLFLETGIMENDGNLKKPITADTIGWQIAPRINAAGRMNHANVAYKLLVTENATDAVDLAYELNQNNRERQTITEELLTKATEQVEKNQLDNPVLFALGRGWLTGIVGLVSGRLKEKYQKPTIVMAENNGEITGSGRSIPGFSLIDSLQEMPEQFGKFGGHPMACGFTLTSPEHVESFKKLLIEKFKEKTKDIDVAPKLEIDANVDLDDITWDLYDTLEKFEPFGQANPRPKYVSYGAEVVSVDSLGAEGKHIKLMAKHNSTKLRKFVGWRMGYGAEQNWCENLHTGDKIDIVYEVGLNEWNGNRELQLTIVDLRISKS